MSIVTFAEPSTYEVTLIRASCKPVLILHREKSHQSGRVAKWHITTATLLEKLNSEAIDGIRALWMEPVFHTSSTGTTQLQPLSSPVRLPPLLSPGVSFQSRHTTFSDTSLWNVHSLDRLSWGSGLILYFCISWVSDSVFLILSDHCRFIT